LKRRFMPGQVGIIEILIVLSSLAVLVSFMAPVRNAVSADSGMDKAVAHVREVLDDARQSSRVFNREVVVHLQTGSEGPDALSYAVPSLNNRQRYQSGDNQGYVLPGSIRLTADRDVIRFEPEGRPDEPVMLVLVSSVDQDRVEVLRVE